MGVRIRVWEFWRESELKLYLGWSNKYFKASLMIFLDYSVMEFAQVSRIYLVL